MVIQIFDNPLFWQAVYFLVKWVLLTIVFYITGRIVSGVNAKFSDAVIVAFVGSVLSAILHWGFDFVFPSLGLPFASSTIELIAIVCSALITVIVYLPLFMHFFDVGFGGAVAIGILCLVIYVLIQIPVVFFPELGWLDLYTPL
jgi:hypothetical protein